MLLSILAFILTTELIILGPGILSPADKNVLENVAEKRLRYGYSLTKEPDDYDVLIGVENCQLLDKSGWLFSANEVHTVLVVDCEASHHKGQMRNRGLLADVNAEELGHKKGWIVLR